MHFAEILDMFDDPYVLERYDREHSINEPRWKGIGSVRSVFVVFSCYTDRNSVTRIYSAREATPKEKKDYASYIAKAIG
jgi:uncharacterized DUF497 family protein